MKKIFLSVFFSVVCIGCSLSPVSFRSIEIVLGETHPWEIAATKQLWYTLRWTAGDGTFGTLHIPQGIRKVRISVPRGKTLCACAYPLGCYHPLGGALIPSENGPLVLVQEEGTICELLLSISKTGPEAVSQVNYPRVLQLIKNKTDDLELINPTLLAKDLLNGELSSSSLEIKQRVSVFIEDIPPGYWIAERKNDGAFWSQFGDGGVGLLVSDGLHCFLNREDGLLLKVFADDSSLSFFTSIHEAPHW
ncbi:hypothetical protein [uncultured Sphaerochaeta sp.]|uniref:hypothetical protein n=1 Tax=uncultured Sphaerochaeta sp. TaxID=886478 RepID=UPI002A0A245A|nr:hypothetical protein [uncultured Sphaerochaeta sp.]